MIQYFLNFAYICGSNILCNTTVENLTQLYNDFVFTYGVESVGLIVLILALFIIQIYYYIGVYGRIAKYRIAPDIHARSIEGISVVVVVRDDFRFVEQILPRLLTQEYESFEVVVVDVGLNSDVYDILQNMKLIYPNLTTTKFKQDPRFPISNKMALNVGIKAAHHEYMVITTSDSSPASQKWLSLMAKGFAKGDVVLGYCSVEPRSGLANKLMRATRLMQGMRFLGSAIRGLPYRGMIQNLGLTRTLYFSVKGFDHLNMNVGEDDLFIQRIASQHNTSVVMHPHATVVQHQWGGLSWWRRMRRFYGFTFRYYPSYVKHFIGLELISRLMFVVAVMMAVIFMPLYVKIGAAAVWLLRLVVVEFQIVKIGRRLGDRGLMWTYILHDFLAPFDEIMLSLVRRFRTVTGIWR